MSVNIKKSLIFGVLIFAISSISFAQKIEQTDSVASDTVKVGFFKKLFSIKKNKQKNIKLPNEEISYSNNEGVQVPDMKSHLESTGINSGKLSDFISDSLNNLSSKDSLYDTLNKSKRAMKENSDVVLKKVDQLKKAGIDSLHSSYSGLKDSIYDVHAEHKIQEKNEEIKRLAQEVKTTEAKVKTVRDQIESIDKIDQEKISEEYLKRIAGRKNPFEENYHSSYLEKVRNKADEVNTTVDSIRNIQNPFLAGEEKFTEINVRKISEEVRMKIDSLKPKLPFKEEIKNISDSINQLNFKRKNFKLFGDFKEVIVGFPDNLEKNFSVSPSMGYNLSKSIAVGIGLVFDLNIKEKTAVLGYKSFIRYSPINNIYAQVESTHYFKGISNLTNASDEKQVSGYQSNIAAGLGGSYELLKGIDVNFQLLYQLIRSNYYPNNSPLVFRVGINF